MADIRVCRGTRRRPVFHTGEKPENHSALRTNVRVKTIIPPPITELHGRVFRHGEWHTGSTPTYYIVRLIQTRKACGTLGELPPNVSGRIVHSRLPGKPIIGAKYASLGTRNTDPEGIVQSPASSMLIGGALTVNPKYLGRLRVDPDDSTGSIFK